MMNRLILVLLIFLSLSTAADFSDFVSKTSSSVSDEGNLLVDATGTGANQPVGLAKNIYRSFAPAACELPTNSDSSSLAPTIVVFTIVILGIAIIYMAGQFLVMPNLIALSKEEGLETVRTLIRVSLIIGMFLVSQSWFGLSSPTTTSVFGQKTMMNGALAFSRLMVNDMVTHYSSLLIFNTMIHKLYSTTLYVGTSWRSSWTFNLGSVLRPIIDVLGTTLQFLSAGVTEWLLHIVTLCIIKKYVWTIFMPLGILLRSIPYTRNAGEALMTISFALAVIYPFTFLLDYEVHKMMQVNVVDAKQAVDAFINKTGILGVFGSAIFITVLAAGALVPFLMGAAINLSFELVRGAVYYIVIMSLIMPMINVFITMTMAREIGRFFNVDVNIMSFLRII